MTYFLLYFVARLQLYLNLESRQPTERHCSRADDAIRQT